MRRRFWRFSRPVGSLVCVLLLLLLIWFIRLGRGIPHGSPEDVLRRMERKMLLSPGELVEVYEARFNAANVVTWRDGELAVYYFLPEDDNNKKQWKHRYQDGFPLWQAQPDFDWGCCTGMFVDLNANRENKIVTAHRFYVLVKNPDPQVTRGSLTIQSRLGDYTRKWTAKAERTNPYYLSFRMERFGGNNATQELFDALCSGRSSQGAEAEAEAVFYDADGNEVSCLRFSMIEEENAERSEENGA